MSTGSNFSHSTLPTPQPPNPSLVNNHPMVTRSKVGTFKPKVYLGKVVNLLNTKPVDIHEAMKSEQRSAVVKDELNALHKNGT